MVSIQEADLVGKTPSLAGRAVLAVALMVGFYLLALATALGFFVIPVAYWRAEYRIHIRLTLLCVLSGGMILWSVFPRLDDFVAPGPRLHPGKHPRLFQTLQEIALKTQQEMPAEVYVVSDVNAFVTQRGGVMGFGSRRVMGLGLPLMQALDVNEFRAVLSHEFGHFHGGDTKLGPWIYNTRAAIGRTIQTLHEMDRSLLQKPFEWYGMVFLRITHAISRAQEYAADALAARTVGAVPLASGLKKIGGVSVVYEAYWKGELAPVLRGGFRPPMMSGFGMFLASQKVESALEEMLRIRLTSMESDPYDTHPALPHRLDALGPIPDPTTDASPREPALSLLDDVSIVERDLLVWLSGDETMVAELENATWEELSVVHYEPQWRVARAALYGPTDGATFAELPTLCSRLRPVATALYGDAAARAHESDLRSAVSMEIATALSSALVADGWTPVVNVGETPMLLRGTASFRPVERIGELFAGDLSNEQWATLCADHGFGGLSVGALSEDDG